jgi:pyrroline-5-carboxylate reductase
MRIGVIGCGTIASAVVHGIAGDGHQITVSERSSRYADALAAAYDNVTVADNQGVVKAIANNDFTRVDGPRSRLMSWGR